jgi:tetratricopeptide (TPR) repeat protein/predicted aspartyl protease
MLRALAVALLGIWGISLMPATALAAPEHCHLGILLQLPVTMNGFRPLVDARINDHPVSMLVDSGAFFSFLTPAAAAELQLSLSAAPFELRVKGVAGEMTSLDLATATLTLGGVTFPKKLEFLVGGNDLGGAQGIIGQNILRIADVEYDLANGMIRLIKPEGNCRKTNPMYWTHEGDAYSVMDITWATALEPHTSGVALLNGSKLKVIFDTGAGTSMLTLRAAERAGIKPDSHGVTPAGLTYGMGQGFVKTWIGPFESFKLGSEEIRNTHLRFGELQLTDSDMLIGPDFFLSHRVYVASSQRKLYFTYNGGPVFNLSNLRATDTTSSQKPGTASPTSTPPAQNGSSTNTTPTATQTPPGRGGDSADEGPATADDTSPNGEPPPGALAGAGGVGADPNQVIAGAEPTTAEEFSRRGAAYTARHDYSHAIADLNHACELDPSQAKYFMQRATAYWFNRQPDRASLDIDTAIKLNPDDVDALLWRGQQRLLHHDRSAALVDLDAADHAATAQASNRFRLGQLYQRAGQYQQAATQYGLWIDAHKDDVNVARAYTARCWVRGLSGQELDQGLSDCNKALHRMSDSPGALASRGLIYLRLEKFDRAISDYSAALKQQPKNAWAFYGRGLAESHKQTAAADQDIAAATALAPHIAEQFKKLGIAR